MKKLYSKKEGIIKKKTMGATDFRDFVGKTLTPSPSPNKPDSSIIGVNGILNMTENNLAANISNLTKNVN